MSERLSIKRLAVFSVILLSIEDKKIGHIVTYLVSLVEAAGIEPASAGDLPSALHV